VAREKQNDPAPCGKQRERDMNRELSASSNKLFRWMIWLAGAVALAYLIAEHRPHLLGWIPYLIILACPLMHLFMHRGHGRHDGRDQSSHKH
jgi:Flp pilus assembly protein TadB